MWPAGSSLLRLTVAAVAVSMAAPSAHAANRFYAVDVTIDALSTETTSVEIRGDNDGVILGYSVAVTVDPARIEVVDLHREGTVGADAEFFGGGLDVDAGAAAFGVVFDVGGDFSEQRLDAGANRLIAILTVRPRAAVDATGPFVFEPVELTAGRPAIRNVMTNDEGFSIRQGGSTPALQLAVQNGTITLDRRLPSITAVRGNSGLAGTVFEVDGENFDLPGLAVEVCGVAAAFTRTGATLEVTAPECGSEGFAALEVCTERGCDTETQGFRYTAEPVPNIASTEDAQGLAGEVFRVLGVNFLEPLTVRVCGADADYVHVSDELLEVTAPACGSIGPANVEVCNDFGCDTQVGGFVYEDDNPVDQTFLRGDTDGSLQVDITDGIRILNFLFLGGPASRCRDSMDSNDSGSVDLTDGVYVFNFLFLGGPQPPAPFPAPGQDPTEDRLPECTP